MGLAVTIALFILGVILVIKGGDFFVDAASWIAEVSGMPKVLVGATIVSLATTLPEMLVSVMAATRGEVDMSIGNAVGSVTANIGLIMGISLVFMPGVIQRKNYLFKSVLMLVAAALVVFSGLSGQVGVGFSAALMVIFVLFIVENVLQAKRSIVSGGEAAGVEVVTKKGIALNILKFVGGAAAIVWGADLLVDNGSELARLVGVSERIIGVTIIAVGTSLPELITTITAISKKQSALSVGNILGANIMDLTLIMPLSALISGKALPVSPVSAAIDLPACLIVGVVAILPAMIKSEFKRWQGVLLLVLYAAYVALTCMS